MEEVNTIIPMGGHARTNRIQIDDIHTQSLEMRNCILYPFQITIEEIEAPALRKIQRFLIECMYTYCTAIKAIFAFFGSTRRIAFAKPVGKNLVTGRAGHP